jgi:hypothetical protein
LRQHETRRQPFARQTWIWLNGKYRPAGHRPLICVNPLNWQRDAACATKGVASLPKPLPELTGATCQGSLIVVPLSALAVGCRFNDLLTLFGSYHHFDYDLLYINIRQRAAERVAAYLARR